VDKELEPFGGRANVAPEKRFELRKLEEEAAHITKVACVVFTVCGVLYLVFGCYIKLYPVAITISALILFITGNIVSAVFDPEMVLKGIIIKICIAVALAKSIQSALAFEMEQKLARRRESSERRRPVRYEDDPPVESTYVQIDCPACGESMTLPEQRLTSRLRCRLCRALVDIDPLMLPARARDELPARARRRRDEEEEFENRTSNAPVVWIIVSLLILISLISRISRKWD